MFDRDQLRIYLYDDLKNSPATILYDIFRFLTVDPDYVVDTTQTKNVSSTQYTLYRPKQRLIDKHLLPSLQSIVPTGEGPLQESSAQPESRKFPTLMRLAERARFVIQRGYLSRRFLLKHATPLGFIEKIPFTPKLDQDTYQQLAAVYQDELAKLEQLLQRDLSHWRP